MKQSMFHKRRITFSQYGDPHGLPVLYFHGWPASRLSAAIHDPVAKKYRIRLIAPDRPGFGGSDFLPDRTLLDWPNDVSRLADYLGIGTFSVIGVSGGGPYAAVCAYALPRRIISVSIVAGLGRIDVPHALDGIIPVNRLGWRLFSKYRRLRDVSAYLQFLNMKFGIFFGLNRAIWGKQDRELLRTPILGNRLDRTVREAFRQGSKGPAHDLKLYTSDWGFEISDIQVKTYLWYGVADRSVSVNMGRYYHGRIRGSVLREFPDLGHLVSVIKQEDIFKTISAEYTKKSRMR